MNVIEIRDQGKNVKAWHRHRKIIFSATFRYIEHRPSQKPLAARLNSYFLVRAIFDKKWKMKYGFFRSNANLLGETVFMLNYLSVQILYIYLNIIGVRKNINER